jgi:hypothetical protein
MPFILKTPSFYQDRLGTNIGEALKLIQRDAFLQEEPDARLDYIFVGHGRAATGHETAATGHEIAATGRKKAGGSSAAAGVSVRAVARVFDGMECGIMCAGEDDNGLFAPFIYKKHYFTKTGPGQT